MRILFNSRESVFKDPFGTLVPGQNCRLCIHIPVSVNATRAECVMTHADGSEAFRAELLPTATLGAYRHYSGSFSFEKAGLYFYYFMVYSPTGNFRLFRRGEDTNMEAGEAWQLSCVPADFQVPQWALGGTMYQIFPDRFYKAGHCDLTGKLQPYTIHQNWEEEVAWQPTPEGKVLNNDFYGGNLRGIREKLPYLADLGVTVLYLNPISKSFSSHRYDTGDYKQPDPMLGTMEDFRALCDAAHARGIRVILDGVYSHTGSDSLYFDKNRSFGGNGAYCRPDSPYYSWFDFQNWPDKYRSWWDFDTLPTVNKLDPAFIDYIITGEDSVIAHWLKAGCDGFRLDVADELPTEFLTILKKRLREMNPDALLLGEVWEDASNKIAYGQRRDYFTAGQLDSVMNYPFRTAILNFLRGHDDGRGFRETVLTVLENYPPQVALANMNLLGTHDSPRILSALMNQGEGSREENARQHLTPEQARQAKEKLQIASFLQFMLPGMPSIYYGDEAGMEGGKDPFNRRTYPWSKEDGELLAHHKALGRLRKEQEPLRLGDIKFFQAGEGRIGFKRSCNGSTLRIYVNLNRDAWDIPAGKLLFGHGAYAVAPTWLNVEPMGFCITEDM